MNSKSLEFKSKDYIASIQNSLLRTTLQYVAAHSDYYQRLFLREKVDITQIKSTHDLARIPITTKKDLLQNNSQFFCSKYTSDIVMTSGTTGTRPIVHPLSSLDLRRLAYNEKASFITADISRDDSVMLATALDGSFVAGLAYYLGLKEMGCNIFRVGAKNFSFQINMIESHDCNAIIGVPSNLIRLSGFCNELNISLTKIKKLILIGESIRKEDRTLNQLGRRLTKCFPNARLYSTYANTETCTSFCDCSYGKGGHLHPDLAYAEIVDDNGAPVPAGSPGHLVITTFGAHNMPLLRYDTGDITFIDDTPCLCGRTSIRNRPILGRAYNIYKQNGISFSQAQVEEVLLSNTSVSDYCVIINNQPASGGSIHIWISSNGEQPDIINMIKVKIWESIRINAEINMCGLEKLRELQGSTGSRKPVRFIKMESL